MAYISLSKLKPEWVLAGLALGLGSFFAWYVYSLGLTKILIDQNAHLNISRQIIDSMTPGITQLGFWPPLLHILMIPFAASDTLYQTGLAGAFVLVPVLALAAFFLYRLLFLFTQSRGVSFAGAFLFLINPYVLYYSVTPMTEVLFLALLFGTAYFLALWFKEGKLTYLITTAGMIVLAGLTRYEGLLLVPLVGAVFLVAQVLQKRNYQEIEANIILFAFVAVLGALAIVSYSWFFGDDPLAFVTSNWSAFSQQRDYLRPTEGSPVGSLNYLLHSSYYMFGKPMVITALLSFTALIFLFPRLESFAVGLVLLSPFLFDWLSLWRGNIIVYVAELPPFDWFYNERYGLYGIGFAIFAPVVLAGLALRSLKHVALDKAFIASAMLVPLVALQGVYSFKIAFADEWRVVRESAEKSTDQVGSQLAVAAILASNYDGGKILMTRATHDTIAVNASIPIKNYIQESNFPYYDQALLAPWLFARWVVMLNTDTGRAGDSALLGWVKQNERVSQRWANSRTFARFYTLVYENRFERVYKLKEEEVRKYARTHGFRTANIPSLNPDLARWDGNKIFKEMRAEFLDAASTQ